MKEDSGLGGYRRRGKAFQICVVPKDENFEEALKMASKQCEDILGMLLLLANYADEKTASSIEKRFPKIS